MNRRTAACLALALVPAALLGACATTPGSRASIEKLPPACLDTSVAIYFERDSSTVTSEARAVLRSAAQMARGCKIESIRVLGLADATGAPGANQALSELRVRATTDALAAVGFATPQFDSAALGEAGAMTPQGEAQPLRRRADVRIDLSPPR
jgi:peptidoglycan-associated lipoprotein